MESGFFDGWDWGEVWLVSNGWVPDGFEVSRRFLPEGLLFEAWWRRLVRFRRSGGVGRGGGVVLLVVNVGSDAVEEGVAGVVVFGAWRVVGEVAFCLDCELSVIVSVFQGFGNWFGFVGFVLG